MSKISKATNDEKERRIFTVQGWIVDGVQDYMIKRQIMGWGLSGRQADRYIKLAYERWKPIEEISIEERRAAKIADLKQLRRSLQEKFKGTPEGIRAIMNIEKQIIRLEDITPARRLQLSGDSENPLKIETTIEAIEIVRIEK